MFQNLLKSKLDLKIIYKVLYGIFILGLILYLVLYLINAYTSIRYPFQIDYGEGFLLNQARLIAQGESIYQDITSYPYIVGNYPPLYPLITAFLVKIFGISFATGRFVSVLSAILIGYLIYIIVREKTNNQIALISSLLFFASPYIYIWTCLFRVDTLGLLFSLLGIYLIFRYENSKKIYFSVFPFILSLFTKQSFIAAPLSGFIYTFIKDRRRCIIISVLFGLLYSLLFFTINYLTNGQFYLHTIVYNANRYSIFAAIMSYVKAIQIHAILFGFAFAYALYVISRKETSLFVIYFILSALIAFTVGKVGASINYMIELITTSCILFGVALSRFLSLHNKEISFERILIVVLLLTQLVLFAHMPHIKTAEDINIGQKVSSYIMNANDTILSEDAGLLVINRKTVLFQPFIFTQLQQQGLWNQSKLINDIQTRKFSLIILEFDVSGDKVHESRFTKEMIDAIRENYYLVEKVGKYYIYMPKKIS